jgi:phosphoribosylformimino-5-aminoimidazole carboxamide ribotide isomerase
MQVIPSLDIQAGRSRLVWWPGASTGSGVPTDRPERIAEALVAAGAPVIHLVDQDGAKAGRPVNTTAIAAVARAVAVPLQVAGGVDGPEQIELAFAAGATRVVLPLWAVAEDRDLLAACLRIASDWLAVGLDARPERLREYPWRARPAPTLEGLVAELAGEGVRRFVLSHGGAAPDAGLLARLARVVDAEIAVAGGVSTIETLLAVRDAGAGAVILGEAVFTGAVDLAAATSALGRDPGAGS